LKISARAGSRLPERDLKQRRDFLQHHLHAGTDRPQALANHLVTACSSPADGAGNNARENSLRHFIPGNKIFNTLANFFASICLEQSLAKSTKKAPASSGCSRSFNSIDQPA
jgi:hypothetical protein